MTNVERSTYPSSSKPYGASAGADAADASTDDLASKGAAAFREVKAGVESVIADAEEKGQQALKYAGQKGQEAMDNVREVRDTLAVAVDNQSRIAPTPPSRWLWGSASCSGQFGAVERESSRVRRAGLEDHTHGYTKLQQSRGRHETEDPCKGSKGRESFEYLR